LEVVMMTPVLSIEAFAALGAPNLVYVRPIKAAEILASTSAAQIESFELDPDQTLYAVHRADGERLAVLTDKDAAMAAALAHELAPVSVALAPCNVLNEGSRPQGRLFSWPSETATPPPLPPCAARRGRG
jgi:hypothetical protein